MISRALSKAGYRIAHIDSNPYYGADEASLSLEELIQWADKAASGSDPTSRFQCVTRSAEVPSQSRQFSICLQPSVIPSVGPLISSLIASSVAKYSGFRLLDCISVYDSSGRVMNVPGSKQDIFKSKAISLIEKRRLMRFLTFALGDFEGAEELKGKEGSPFLEFLSTIFSLSHELSSIIAYSLAFSMSPSGASHLLSLASSKFNSTPNRHHSTGPPTTAKVSAVWRTLWAFTLSYRSLWRYRRYNPRVL